MTGLLPNTSYAVKLRAYRHAAFDLFTVYSEESNTLEVTTSPNTPVIPSLTVISASEIDLTWPIIPEANGYELEYQISGGIRTPITTGFTINGNNVEFKHKLLTPGTIYTYYLRATNIASTPSEYTNPVSAMTLAVNPITLLSATLDNITTVTLNWTVCDGAVGYRVDASTNGITFTPQQTVTTVTTITLNQINGQQIATNSLYQFRISVTDLAGKVVTTSNTLSVVTASDAPANVIASAINDTQVEVTWSNVNGAKTYQVQRRLDGDTL